MPDEFQVTVTLDGNFFRKDPAKTLGQNLHTLMEQLAEWGEGDVKSQIESRADGMARWSGWTRDRIVGRTRSYSGRQWAWTAVVSANTEGMSAKDAIRTKAAASTIEARWHPFRRTATRMRRAAPIFRFNLARGLE